MCGIGVTEATASSTRMRTMETAPQECDWANQGCNYLTPTAMVVQT